MSVKQVLQLESESVSCQPVTIPFEFTRLESLPEGKTVGDSIAITPITVRTWFRIKPLLLYIDKEDREVLIADKNKVVNTLKAAFLHQQYQPFILGYKKV